MRTVATGREECVRMPMKAARLGPRPVFRLPQMPVAARASHLACGKPGKNGNIQASFRVIRGIPARCASAMGDGFHDPIAVGVPFEVNQIIAVKGACLLWVTHWLVVSCEAFAPQCKFTECRYGRLY